MYAYVVVTISLCAVAFSLGTTFERRHTTESMTLTDAAAWLRAAADKRATTGNPVP